LQYLQEIFRFCWPEIINVYWQNRAQNGYLISQQSSAKYEDTTKTKYMTGLVDKAIAKVNQNELDWNDIFFNTPYSVSKNNRLFSDCTFLLDVCINFIKTLFQILRNDVIDNINKFYLATQDK